MIVEKAKELLALTNTQRLNYTRESSMGLPMVTLWGSLILGLLLTIDYGYMIYLHYKMVSTSLTREQGHVIGVSEVPSNRENSHSLPAHSHFL
jgi:hypothetical protein